MIFVKSIVILGISIALISCGNLLASQDIPADELYVSSTAKILRSKGYMAIDHYVSAQNGAATLNLVRATNPHIKRNRWMANNRDPLLFVHGIFTCANMFMVNSKNVKSRDYTGVNISFMETEELQMLLQDDPASESLVFTALNFGHEVWLLNRRPTLESQMAYLHYAKNGDGFTSYTKKAMKKSLKKLKRSKKYWNFSFDEQAYYDIPEVIDYVLYESGKEKLTYVGYSAGSKLFLMSLILRPDITEKISKAILWAPTLYPSIVESPQFELFHSMIPILAKKSSPIPKPNTIGKTEAFFSIFCSESKLGRTMLCYQLIDCIFGPGTEQQLIENLNARTQFLGGMSSHEAAQNLKARTQGFIQPFKYVKDLYTKGRPYYDVSKIKLKTISLWAGNTDQIMTVPDMVEMINDFTVPVEINTIGRRGVHFNHFAFLTHKDITNLLIIPSLEAIELD